MKPFVKKKYWRGIYMSKRETVLHVSVGGLSPVSHQGARVREHLQVPPSGPVHAYLEHWKGQS